MKNLSLLICLFGICACSSVGMSSGVLPKGNGVYTVSTDYFSVPAAKKSAYNDAIEYCKKENKTIKVLSGREVPVNKYDLEFTCE